MALQKLAKDIIRHFRRKKKMATYCVPDELPIRKYTPRKGHDFGKANVPMRLAR